MYSKQQSTYKLFDSQFALFLIYLFQINNKKKVDVKNFASNIYTDNETK